MADQETKEKGLRGLSRTACRHPSVSDISLVCNPTPFCKSKFCRACFKDAHAHADEVQRSQGWSFQEVLSKADEGSLNVDCSGTLLGGLGVTVGIALLSVFVIGGETG